MKREKNISKAESFEKEDLLFIEEIFRRLNQSAAVELYAPLAKKSSKPELLARLAKIEREIIARAKEKTGL